jgi:1,4-dihydroxy-2-naphthoate octaprenyltransferase
MNSLAPSHPALTPGSFRAWVLACRPATLAAAAAPVLVGAAVAAQAGAIAPGPFAATLFGAFCLQIASNFANDVFDHEKGADTEERLGPTRAVQAGLISARAMKGALAVALALALLTGIYLTSLAGWPIVAIGLASMASAVAYTGGPYPLGYHGLGDLFVMIFFGFVAVAGTTFVQLGSVPPLAYIAGGVMGGLCTNILVVNNLRDRQTDAKAGKMTLAVRFGRTGALVEYWFLLLAAYLTAILLVVFRWVGPLGLLPIATLPLALKTGLGVSYKDGRDLNIVLVRTARLLFVFGFLWSLGLFLDARL